MKTVWAHEPTTHNPVVSVVVLDLIAVVPSPIRMETAEAKAELHSINTTEIKITADQF